MPKRLNAGTIKASVDLVGSLAFIAACGAIVWSVAVRRPAPPAAGVGVAAPAQAKARPPAPLPAEPVSLDGAILRGDPKAKVAVIEYSEFQCPYCGKFAQETMPALAARYVDSGKVLWAFRHFPLEQIHPNALRAGMAGECAARQGKFWQIHDVLFRNQAKLDEANLDGYVKALGLKTEDFEACMKGPAESEVRADMRAAQALGVTGTPTFLLGRVELDGRVKVLNRFSGALPLERFAQALDPLLFEKQTDSR